MSECSIDGLPVAFAAALAGFADSQRLERNRSEHTLRAYLGDVTGLFEFLMMRGIHRLDRVTLSDLRRWLAVQHAAGLAPATLQRRSGAIRGVLMCSPLTMSVTLMKLLKRSATNT